MNKKIRYAYFKLFVYRVLYFLMPFSEGRHFIKKKKHKYKDIIRGQYAKPKMDYLEIQIVDHCNLNCKGCTHYCGITEPKFYNVEDFERDLRELSSKLDIGVIRLMGGEPLLHKDVNKFLVIARQFYPNSDIRIVTNGILLSKMEEEFWNTLRDTKIKIDMSIYPMGGTAPLKALDAIGKHVFKYYVHESGWTSIETALGYTPVASKFIMKMDKNAGIENAQSSFDKCHKTCKNFRDGKIFHCPEACYLDNYNKYFKTDLVAEKGISIYEHTAEEILEYLSKPIETCKYCVFDDRIKLIDWQISKKEADEWFI